MSTSSAVKNWRALFSLPVIVAALGYFVDIYDLLLFGIVRVPSLRSLGLDDQQISSVGASILNWQMVGLLAGGILWGVLGDRKGRLSVLFGSILTYSLANIACGMVNDPTVYKVLRFVAGVGLAGELGAGITLVSEIVPKEIRALATSLVAAVGLLGAVVAYFTVELFDWRTAYYVGGALGLSLLLLRIGVFESGVFENIRLEKNVSKGNFFSLLTDPERRLRYLKCIGIGLPTWFVIGILITFSNEFGAELNLAEPIKPGRAIMWAYCGLSLGDIASGYLSHCLRSRKRAVLLMMTATLFFSGVYLFAGLSSAAEFYSVCALLGFGIGYWAMFVTIGAEQFGTNLRATAATTIPNMVRGTVVLMTTLYGYSKQFVSVPDAAAIVGVICFGIGYLSILTISETHNRDLDFLES